MSAPETAPVVIDGGDRTCTALLLELRGHLTRLPPGTVIHLIARDPAAPLDLAAWCHLTGHTYLGPVPVPAAAPAYALRTSAAFRPTQPHSPWRLTDDTGRARPSPGDDETDPGHLPGG
jgi:tRNA 2-thiouridine synthesizing protein A